MKPGITHNEKAEALLERLLKALRGAMAERGVKWFAGEIGLRHETLLHKLEPDNPADMLTLRQFARVLVRLPGPPLGDVMRPLAAELGGQWLTVPDAEQVGDDLHKLYVQASGGFGRVAEALLQGSDPNGPGGADWTEEELDALEREADQANDKLHLIVAAARHRKAATPLTVVGKP